MKRHKVTTELPFVGVDDMSIVKDSAGEVHVFAHPEEEVVIHQENPKTGEVGQDGHVIHQLTCLKRVKLLTYCTLIIFCSNNFLYVSKLEL